MPFEVWLSRSCRPGVLISFEAKQLISSRLRFLAFFAPALLVGATEAATGAARDCGRGAFCAGTELIQNAKPDRGAPDLNSDKPDSRSMKPEEVQPPENGGDDDGGDSEETTPPNTAEPHGCIFRDSQLELIV